MPYKRKPKNKQELPSKSGYRPKKELPKKTIVEFGFTTPDGKKFKIGCGRIKVSEEGGVNCLIRDEEGKWKNVKGQLDFIKMKTVVIKREKTKK